MKKIVAFFISFILLMTICKAQDNISIVMRAQLNFQPIPFGCVVVTNRSTPNNARITMYYPDTILRNFHVGIQDFSSEKSSFELQQNYPNPFSDITKINMVAYESGSYVFTIFNLYGAKCFEKTLNLEEGDYVFNVKTGNSGVYFLSVWNGHYRSSVKMINYSSKNNSLFDITSSSFSPKLLSKSKASNQYFSFNTGDTLAFVCYLTLADSVMRLHSMVVDSVHESGAVFFPFANNFSWTNTIPFANSTWEAIAYESQFSSSFEQNIESRVYFYDSTFYSVKINGHTSYGSWYFNSGWDFNNIEDNYWGKYRVAGARLYTCSLNESISSVENYSHIIANTTDTDDLIIIAKVDSTEVSSFSYLKRIE